MSQHVESTAALNASPATRVLREPLRAVLVWLITAAALAALVLSWLITEYTAGRLIDNALFSLVILLPLAIAHLLIRARPHNAVGWLLLFEALVLATMALTDAAEANAMAHLESAGLGERLAILWAENYWPLMFTGFAGIAYVFPTGDFFSARYRRWGWSGLAAVAAFLLIATFTQSPIEPPFEGVVNPLAFVPVEVPAVLAWALLLYGLAALVAAAFSVRARLRASSGERRLQMLWLAWAAIWIPLTLLLCLVDGVVFGDSGGEGVLTSIGLILMMTLMPTAIGIGILRYRLFDIELVINRTLVYGTLTVIVGAAYAAIVAGCGALIGSATAAGVIGAGVVAVLVQPIHARLQRRVDRWIYGDRTDPYAALQRLDARLLETQTPADVVQAVVDSVAESLRLPWAAVEFERDGDGMTIASHGVRDRGAYERRELWYRGVPVGSLVVEVPRGRPLSELDQRLLNQLASHVGAAVQSARLTIDLQESRKELVTAREEERRRLRRDLHDGVGPSLAAMSLQLNVLRDRIDPEEAALVDQLGAQVQDAIGDIRRLVYELRPPALDQYGLVSALAEQAARMSTRSVRFSVNAPESLPGLPAAVEVAVYRIALEGMTNASRHSGSSRCDVTISLAGDVAVTVQDNGIGIDDAARHGIGLRSMRERTDELGGDFAIGPGDRGGTTLTASFPLEAE